MPDSDAQAIRAWVAEQIEDHTGLPIDTTHAERQRYDLAVLNALDMLVEAIETGQVVKARFLSGPKFDTDDWQHCDERTAYEQINAALRRARLLVEGNDG